MIRDRPFRLILFTCVGVLTLALLTVGSPRPASAVPMPCIPIPLDPNDPFGPTACFPGIVGGGVVQTEAGEAHVSLFATRLEIDDASGDGPLIGAVVWSDHTWEDRGLLLESTLVDAYGPVPGLEGGREIRGLMTANGVGAYPFVLRAVDAGLPGSQQDSVALAVGTFAEGEAAAASDFGYGAEGTVVGGDLQVLTVAVAGTPTS